MNLIYTLDDLFPVELYNDAKIEHPRLFGNYSPDGILKTAKVGSRVTCNPAPTDTDEDFLLLIDDVLKFQTQVESLGYFLGGSNIPHEDNTLSQDDRFMSFTKEIDGIYVNLIVTQSLIFFEKFMTATHVARRLNILNKEHRIVLFQAILYGNKV